MLVVRRRRASEHREARAPARSGTHRRNRRGSRRTGTAHRRHQWKMENAGGYMPPHPINRLLHKEPPKKPPTAKKNSSRGEKKDRDLKTRCFPLRSRIIILPHLQTPQKNSFSNEEGVACTQLVMEFLKKNQGHTHCAIWVKFMEIHYNVKKGGKGDKEHNKKVSFVHQNDR